MMVLLVFLVAAGYASVGHGGASGYIAIMGLSGVDPSHIRSTALVLNVLVSAIGTWSFVRAGHFRGTLLWRFLPWSLPMALWGGSLTLASEWYRWLLGVVLLVSSLRLLWEPAPTEKDSHPPPWWLAAMAACGIGFVSGLVGVGGGIFLTPLLLLAGWAKAREAAAVSAPFICMNSLAGLLGSRSPWWSALHEDFPWLVLAVLSGGILGSAWGSRFAGVRTLRRVLAAVILLAAVKLLTLP